MENIANQLTHLFKVLMKHYNAGYYEESIVDGKSYRFDLKGGIPPGILVAKVGLTKEEAYEALRLMADKGWVKDIYDRPTDPMRRRTFDDVYPYLYLPTSEGIDFFKLVSHPWYRKAWDYTNAHPFLRPIIITVAGSVIAAIILHWLGIL
uniref:Uncharacterized protein n=1 Tax=Candidatus Methanophaga sp. ANME-1 ERB7 TaxID=2759913 RepID=A0A7G9ZB50_9EURY|nr:hypothetical protein NKHFOMCA_00022 [Methanosarcinales archaeon ANME-1 ERB7]QNO57484.1 hypothetical protein PBOADKMI_00029 [Methanosarcinales archaeon ANME-1 ERB7]